MSKTKPFCISKQVVWEAYLKVKKNRGTAGVDKQSIAEFEEKLKDNLYKIWNRMASGTYFPPPVLRVEIPKGDGKMRKLGIPTVSDRIAQMVAKLYLEPILEPHFHTDSYGYRPGKSALDALGVTRRRCWQYDWVIDMDVKGFFDNMDHDKMMRAVKVHTDCRWVLLYIERWLKAPVQLENGQLETRGVGTPQGGVISPLISNLFLHYAFDEWMRRNYPACPFARYADDAVVHCQTEQQAQVLLQAIKERLQECGLELHPEKTKIVYCKDGNRGKKYPDIQFDFLGYTFRPRGAVNRSGKFFTSFLPAISNKAAERIRDQVRQWNIQCRVNWTLEDLARLVNPTVQGWINYYGRFYGSELHQVLGGLNARLVRWSQKKYKKLKHHKTRAARWVWRIAKRDNQLFAHWRMGCFEMVGR